MKSVDKCKQELAKQIKAAELNPENVDSPISVAIDILQLRQSDNLVEKSNAEILSMQQDLREEFTKNFRMQSVSISGLQSSLLTIENRNDSKDQSLSIGVIPSTESSFSKEMDWDNFIDHLSLFDRTNLAELLDDLLNNSYKSAIYVDKYVPVPYAHSFGYDYAIPSFGHYHSTPKSGFEISTNLNGNYEIKFQIYTIDIKKEDLKTFRDRVAGRGIYPMSHMSFLGGGRHPVY